MEKSYTLKEWLQGKFKRLDLLVIKSIEVWDYT